MSFNLNGTAYTTLAEAAAAAVAGDEITIDAGTYTDVAATLGVNVSLRGLGATPGDTILTNAAAAVINVAASGTDAASPLRISNLTFADSFKAPVIVGSIFSDNGATPDYTEIVHYIRITNCNFTNVGNGYAGPCVQLRNCTHVEVDTCTFTDAGFGIGMSDYSTAMPYGGMVITDIHIHHNTFTGTETPTNGGHYLYGCMVIDTRRPASFTSAEFMQVYRWTFENNTVTNSQVKVCYVTTGNDIIMRNNTITNHGMYAFTNSRYPAAFDINIKWTKTHGIIIHSNTITTFNKRVDIAAGELAVVTCKARTDGTVYGFLVDGSAYEASLTALSIKGNVITDGTRGICIGNGTNPSPGTGGTDFIAYASYTEHGPYNVEIHNNVIDTTDDSIVDLRYGGRAVIDARYNDFGTADGPGGGCRDAFDSSRIAEGSAAPVQGSNVAFFPHSRMVARLKGEHSTTQGISFAA